MTWRYLPPAYSPLTLGAMVGGAVASIVGRSPSLLDDLRARYPDRRVVLCDSGTSALTLALAAALNGAQNPLVALPAYGCYDLATAAVGVGADVVLYDLIPETLAPDPASLGRALEARPNAIVTAVLYGTPFDVKPMIRQADNAGAVLVEDAAQAIGASCGGEPCGAAGPLGILSFGRGKGATGGGGGALLVEDAGLGTIDPPNRRSGWPGWGKTVIQWALARPAFYRLPASLPVLRLGETIYHTPQPASSMPRVHQEVLARMWLEVDREAEVRRGHGRRLMKMVAQRSDVRPVRATAGVPGYLRFPVLSSALRFRTLAARELGVMAGYPMVLADLPALASRVRNLNDEFPGARRLVDELITLPTHSLLRAADFLRLASLVG